MGWLIDEKNKHLDDWIFLLFFLGNSQIMLTNSGTQPIKFQQEYFFISPFKNTDLAVLTIK